jgi:hypothetical protein
METQGDNYLDVNVAVSDDAIVVTLPGFSATYRKRDEPWLIASDIRDDPSSSISKFTFRAQPGPRQTRKRESLAGSYEAQKESPGTLGKMPTGASLRPGDATKTHRALNSEGLTE